MAQTKYSAGQQKTKSVTAEMVYQLTSEVLQEMFPLDMSGRSYEAQDIWDVLLAAAVERITIEMACEVLTDAPSPNTVRQMVWQVVGEEADLTKLEKRVNQMLVGRLPKKLLQRDRPVAIDITEIPYHGQHEESDPSIRRSKAKHGTTHFHCYATLAVVRGPHRYTLAVTLVRRGEPMQAVVQRLLSIGQDLGLKVRRLYLDRGFDNNGVVAYLKQQPFPTIMALTIRGKVGGGSRALLTGRRSHETSYTRRSTKYGPQTFRVVVVCKYSKGRYKRHGIYRFAYILIGSVKIAPQQVYHLYRRRFGIESSYRLLNTLRPRTTSTKVTLRLFYVALALLLLNLWTFVKWHFLYLPKPGPRQPLHHLLPLALWRLWLWEMVKRRLGFSLEIILPLTV